MYVPPPGADVATHRGQGASNEVVDIAPGPNLGSVIVNDEIQEP